MFDKEALSAEPADREKCHFLCEELRVLWEPHPYVLSWVEYVKRDK